MSKQEKPPATTDVQQRVVAYWSAVDPELGARVADALV